MSNVDDTNAFPPGEGPGPEGGSGNGNGNGEGMPLDAGRPAVAAAPGKMVFIVVLVGVFIFVIVRSLFFGGEKVEEKPKAHNKEQVASASKNSAELPISPGSLPTPPPEIALPPAPTSATNILPPPPPPAPPTPEVHANKGPTDEALKARIKSNMMVASGGGLRSGINGSRAEGTPASNDPNLIFSQRLSGTRAARVEAESIGNLNITIAQGKIVHAVLETAIDSDLPGPIRAIVSHDIYAEAGRDVLIPKGSRLIGTYNSSIKHGQARLFVIWTRLIRPDGIDIAIDSPGVDALGRAGLAGSLDNKYYEMFSTALLTSALDIGVAGVGQGLFGSQNTTQSNSTSGNTTTTTGTAAAAATTQAVQNIGQVGQNIVNNAINLQPTIMVDQGTPVDVFVNKDLVFPSNLTGKSHFVE